MEAKPGQASLHVGVTLCPRKASRLQSDTLPSLDSDFRRAGVKEHRDDERPASRKDNHFLSLYPPSR